MPEQAILFIRISSTIEKVDRKKTVIFLLLQPKHSKIESAFQDWVRRHLSVYFVSLLAQLFNVVFCKNDSFY